MGFTLLRPVVLSENSDIQAVNEKLRFYIESYVGLSGSDPVKMEAESELEQKCANQLVKKTEHGSMTACNAGHIAFPGDQWTKINNPR